MANYTAYVGNLPWRATEDDVADLLKEQGIASVTGVRIIQDRETGRSLGYGFVDCPDAETLGQVCRVLKGAVLDGRRLVAEPSRPQRRSR